MQRSRFVGLPVVGSAWSLSALSVLASNRLMQSLCRSVIVSALVPTQCGTDDTIYDLAIRSAYCGAVLASRTHSGSERSPASSQPLCRTSPSCPSCFAGMFRLRGDQFMTVVEVISGLADYRPSPPIEPPPLVLRAIAT